MLFLKADFFGSRRAFRNLILGPLGAAGASPAFGAVKRFRFLMNALIVKNAYVCIVNGPLYCSLTQQTRGSRR